MIDQPTEENGRTPRIAVERIGQSETYTVSVFAPGSPGKERLVYVNQAKIGSEPVRREIVERLSRQFRIDPTWMKTYLLGQLIAAGARDRISDSAENTLIVSPAGYFDSRVAAIAVPTQFRSEVNWELCVQHHGGLREIIPISSPNISLQDGTRILVHPVPDGDGTGDGPVWSEERRAAWFEGAAPVDPSELVAELAQEADRYVRFPGDDETHTTWCLTLAVFAMFSYIYRASPTTPYLRMTGPTGSGKTRVLEVLREVAFRPVMSCSMSAPTLFRLIDQHGGLLLIDEAEHLTNSRGGASDLLPILLSGYKHTGRTHRTFGNRVRSFRTHGPKAYAAIGESHPTLMNRSITIPMFRDKSRNADRLLDESAQTWREIRDGLMELALSYGCQWHTLFREKRDWGISGRNREVWGPLLRLSSWLDAHGGAESLEERLLAHARQLIAETTEDLIPAIDQTLLRILANWLQALVNSRNDEITLADCPRPSDILNIAKREEPAAFSRISAHRVAAILKGYGLRTHQGNRHVYEPGCLNQLRKIQRAYGICLGLDPEDGETNHNPPSG